MSDEDSLTDAEYAEAKTIHKALKEAYAQDSVVTKQAMKDAVQFPPQSGKVK